MTRCTRFDLAIGVSLDTSPRVSCRAVDRPPHSLSFCELCGQSIVAPKNISKQLRITSPRHVTRSRTVTRFAADTDLRPCRAEFVSRRIVAFSHACRMTIGAHEIPV